MPLVFFFPNISEDDRLVPPCVFWQPENSLWQLEMEEMNEHLMTEADECYWKQKLLPPGKLDSPLCKTPPKSPNYGALWKWNDSEGIINFKLMETPELRKC